METKNAVKQRVVGKPFIKGQSGNPGGRPPRITCVSSLLTELIKGNADKVKAKWLKETKCQLTGGMTVAWAIYSKMTRGDLTACQLGLDRVEGKVTERIDTTTNGESLNHPVVEVVSAAAKSATEAIISGKGVEQCIN